MSTSFLISFIYDNMVDTNSIDSISNMYYINYIDESTNQNELKTFDSSEERISRSPIENHSSRLEVSGLIEEVTEILTTK